MFTFADGKWDKGKQWERGEACVTLLVRYDCIHVHIIMPPFTMAICAHISKYNKSMKLFCLNVESDKKVLSVQVQN